MADRNVKKIVITQSNYIPWKGYFDAIALADEFVIYDDMQFTKRDWRNRNVIKTPQGPKWLTIPVDVKGKYFQKIKDTRISDPAWNKDHWNMIVQNYSRAAHFKELKEFLEELYMHANQTFLTEVNVYFLEKICAFLGIPCRFRMSGEFELHEDRTQRLVDIVNELGGTEYYSGPAAKAYMELNRFEEKQIDVHFDYTGYPEYTQLNPPFDHGVSIIDLLLNEGRNSAEFLKNTLKPNGEHIRTGQ